MPPKNLGLIHRNSCSSLKKLMRFWIVCLPRGNWVMYVRSFKAGYVIGGILFFEMWYK